jgi:predicted enzyme related to lactoylglutathione lyase
LYYISVEDIHAGVERVKEHGGKIVHGPQEVPGGDFIAQCQDPQGAYFALHAMAKKDDS